MTHHPPMPKAATSPYPLHPDPISEPHAQVSETARSSSVRHGGSPSRNVPLIGVGAALALGASALAIVLVVRRVRPENSPSSRASHGDDKANRGAADRHRVASNQPYEVTYFARKHGITAAVARQIIKEAGSDRKRANALAAGRGGKQS